MPGVDVRQVPVRWAELEHLVEGARRRGFGEEQLEYLRSCLGLSWAKAMSRGLAQGDVE